MNIVIEKSKAVEQLHLLSAHLGLKMQAPEIVCSVEDDEERIEPLWKAAAAELARLLAPYCAFVLADNSAEYSLEMPDNWRSDQSDALLQHCMAFIGNSLLARWLYPLAPESAALYKNMNVECASAITNILAMRCKPKGL